ncbi:hypothetical protein LCGC14_0249250 [marine sediment metagenome]|uniref:Uncharacterized protein n=1 Tax=marine sediment metagenome TaxID=412755 RepID=A0A0F9ULN9_9ZZZZ
MSFVLDDDKPSVICTFCERLDNITERSCEAYLENKSIPSAIWNGGNNHTDPFPGDNGKRFVLLGDKRPEDVEK